MRRENWRGWGGGGGEEQNVKTDVDERGKKKESRFSLFHFSVKTCALEPQKVPSRESDFIMTGGRREGELEEREERERERAFDKDRGKERKVGEQEKEVPDHGMRE